MGDFIDLKNVVMTLYLCQKGIELYMDTMKDHGRFEWFENIAATLYLWEKDLKQMMVMWSHMLLLLTWYWS